MNRLEELHRAMTDHQIDLVNNYIQGERVYKSHTTRREREDVSFSMIHTINEACGIHSDGLSMGTIDPAGYKREKKRREGYWKKVNAGKITDTRRGYDKYRSTTKERNEYK